MPALKLPFRHVLLGLALLLGGARPGLAYHAGDMIIGSTVDGGGALTLAYDFAKPVRVSSSISAGGMTLFTSTDPGFDALDTVQPGLFQLAVGTPVAVEIVSIDAAASAQVHSSILVAPGDAAQLGNMTADGDGLHVHPTWRLVLADDAPPASVTISFRLTTTSTQYGASDVHTLTVTNEPATTTTTIPGATTTTDTTTSTTTSTTVPAVPCAAASGTYETASCRFDLVSELLEKAVPQGRRARRVVTSLRRGVGSARLRVDEGFAAGGSRGRKLFRRAALQLTRLGAKAARAAEHGQIDRALAEAINVLPPLLQEGP